MKFLDPAAYLPSVPHFWVKRIAQVGLITKGAVYFLLGVLALAAAFGLGRDTREVNRKEVFLFIEELLLGRVLLLIVSVGLACYCAWRLLQAITDTEEKGPASQGLSTGPATGPAAPFMGFWRLCRLGWR
ncbi:DUF1206 domain-containing protein [Pontibacter rugosus]